MTTKLEAGNIQPDLTKAGFILVRDESGNVVEEQYLSKAKGGFGEDITSANGYAKLINGELSFEQVEKFQSEWTSGLLYKEGYIVKYRSLLFGCITEHESSALFADDLAYWEPVSPNAIICVHESHGFNLYQPIYKNIQPETINVEQFTTVGVTSWTVPSNIYRCDVLIVGGGGGGSREYNNFAQGGAGGAAGVQRYYANYKITPSSNISVTVGAGGAGGTYGVNAGSGGISRFGDLSATGGGGALYYGDNSGDNADYQGASISTNYLQGGGAGAGGNAPNNQNGGTGKYNSITGTNVIRGGGGGGAGRLSDGSGVAGSGGAGGGGSGVATVNVDGVSGAANTGSGGGGKVWIGTSGSGGAGGSGVVIVRWKTTSSSWELAQSDNPTTLGQYVIIEKNTDMFLAVNNGFFECIDHQLGSNGTTLYVSDSTAGTLVSTADQNIVNPVMRIVDSNTIEVVSYSYYVDKTERRITSWSSNVEYVENKVVEYQGILFSCKAYHISSAIDFATDLQYWEPLDNRVVIGLKSSHGFNQLSPIYLSDNWYKAIADSSCNTLGTHVVLISNTNYFLAVEGGSYSLPMHGKTPGTYYCSEVTAGETTTSPTNIWSPVFIAKNANDIEVISNSPAEDRTNVTNIDDGYHLVYYKNKYDAVALSESVPIDGERYSNIKVLLRVKGFLSGGNNTLTLNVRIYPNGDTNIANYRCEYQRLYSASDVTGAPTSSPYYYASTGGFLLNYNSVGGYGFTIGEFNLKSGMNRIGFTQAFIKRASGTSTRFLEHVAHEWLNSASPITSLLVTADQYTDCEIYIYART